MTLEDFNLSSLSRLRNARLRSESRTYRSEVIRSNATAELLSANGATLPPSISESALRPVSALPSPELQIQAWRLVQAASPAGVTQPIASKVARVIKNAIETPGASTGHKPRKREHHTREQSFIVPVQRLSAYQGFDASLVTSHIENFSSARSVFTACRIMADRCLGCCDLLSNLSGGVNWFVATTRGKLSVKRRLKFAKRSWKMCSENRARRARQSHSLRARFCCATCMRNWKPFVALAVGRR